MRAAHGTGEREARERIDRDVVDARRQLELELWRGRGHQAMMQIGRAPCRGRV